MKGMYKMTLAEYKELRKEKDALDMKYYKQELLYWLKLIPIALFGYVLVWLILAM